MRGLVRKRECLSELFLTQVRQRRQCEGWEENIQRKRREEATPVLSTAPFLFGYLRDRPTDASRESNPARRSIFE
jgi:hypothetical protein